MIDGVIAGNGKSRYLKSDISADMTWEDFKAALRTGTIPADLSGYNPDGWTQIGTALSKLNLLSDATVAALEAALDVTLPANPTPNDAFNALAIAPAKISIASYVGTNTYGSGNPTSIVFDYDPDYVMIRNSYYCGPYYFIELFDPTLLNGTTRSFSTTNTAQADLVFTYNAATKTLSWYNTANASNQLNQSGYKYFVTSFKKS